MSEKKKFVKNIIGEKIENKPFTGDPNKVYENYNKLHPMLWDYRVNFIKTLKGKFVEQLDIAKAEEKQYCDAHKMPPKMTGKLYNEVLDLLMQCNTFFAIEALARYVFDQNEIPRLEDVKTKAYGLRLALGIEVKN